ncbi:MAG: phosphatidylserine decarboxylase [Limisphaerales bacterium]
MKHAGKARRAAFKLILLALVIPVIIGILWFMAVISAVVLPVVFTIAVVVWVAFTIFTLYFFRDPQARTPTTVGCIVSPGHGKVDVIDDMDEPVFMKGCCHRISIFLSVINIHVQNAPISGKVVLVKETEGQFLSALKAAECCQHNENVYIGFDSTENAGEKLGLKLMAGLIARRIVPFVEVGDEVARGDRISLIQFGSRCDVYIPLSYNIKVKLGDKVVGGETVLASRS